MPSSCIVHFLIMSAVLDSQLQQNIKATRKIINIDKDATACRACRHLKPPTLHQPRVPRLFSAQAGRRRPHPARRQKSRWEIALLSVQPVQFILKAVSDKLLT